MIPARGRRATSIHRVLASFDIADVVAMALGNHELFNETEVSVVQRWLDARSPAEVYKWQDGDVADTELARLLARRFSGLYGSKYDAAVGASLGTLNSLLYKPNTYLLKSTKGILSKYLEIDSEELSTLNVVYGNEMQVPKV